MAYESLEDFQAAIAFLDGGDERYAVEQLGRAAKVIGPLALKSGILRPNAQIVKPDLATMQQMGPRGLRLALMSEERRKKILARDMANEQAAIIDSYSPILRGWTIYDTGRQSNGYSEKVILGYEPVHPGEQVDKGVLAVIGGWDMRMPEEGLLTAPYRLPQTPSKFSPAYDELLRKRQMTGMITPKTYETGRLGRILQPLLTVEGIAHALQSFAEHIGMEDAVAAKQAGEEWPAPDEYIHP